MVTPIHAVILTHWVPDEIDAICNCIFLNENVLISIKISLKFILQGPINNIPTLVQIMAWRWTGAKPLCEPMMIILLTHIWSQWVNPQWVSQSVNTYHGAVSRHCLHEIVMCDACYRALFAIGIVCWTFYRIIRCNFAVNAGSAEHCNHALVSDSTNTFDCDVTQASWRLKTPITLLCVQLPGQQRQYQSSELLGPLWGESTDDQSGFPS